MMSKKKNCILITILLIVILLFTGYTVNAETNEKISEGQSSDETYIRLVDLYEKYYILCSCHGGSWSHLPSENNVTLTTEKGTSEEGYLTPNDIGKQLFRHTNTFNPFVRGTYKHETYAYYKVVEEKNATPMEAYILSEMERNTRDKAGSDNYTDVQHAWWTTPAGSKGQTTVAPNSLSKTASAFQEYIYRVAERGQNGGILYTDQEYKVKAENGSVIKSGTIFAPIIKYDIKINEDANQDGTVDEFDEPTVCFDANTGKYRIGPFSLDYVDDSYTTEEGQEIKFAGLESFKIYGNTGEIPENKWSFYWLKGERDNESTEKFPAANEVFYIDVDYIKGLKEIKDIKVKAKYLNGAGKYEDLEGTYYKATWKANNQTNWDEDENETKYISSREYWVQLMTLEKFTGQRIASGLIGVRWYEEVEISLGFPDEGIHKGRLKVTKIVDGDYVGDELFDFDIYIDGAFFDRASISPNDSYYLTYEWEDGEVPTYEVREVGMPDGYQMVSISNASGTLIEDEEVEIVCINTPPEEVPPPVGPNDVPPVPPVPPTGGTIPPTTETTPPTIVTTPPENTQKKGNLVISKKVVGKPKDGDINTNPTFTFEITITEEGKAPTTRQVTIGANETYQTEDFVWTNQAPVYTVTELNVPEGCSSRIHNGRGTLQASRSVWVNCTNTYTENIVQFTMPLGGKVWKDTVPIEKENEAYANGLCDENEEGMEKIEVYVWEVIGGRRELARILEKDSDSEISQPLYTNEYGIWEAPRVEIPYDENGGLGYYEIEFKYDGQTYEPTTALVTGGGDAISKTHGNASVYMNASTSERDNFQNDSMAIENENERETYNRKFEEIYGQSAIDENGNTIGAATGMSSLEYSSYDYAPTGSNNTRKISELVTLDAHGYVLDKYKISAKTTELGLYYPFDDQFHMKKYDKTIAGLGETTTYMVTDQYLENINLGLVERPKADISITKDLYSAKVTVNNKLITYKYSTLVDLEEEPWSEALTQQIKVADQDVKYDLNLYKSDYFYRAAIYDSNTMGYGDDIISQIKSVKTPETEMDVYLTYKITTRNESGSLYATINEIADYYDSTLTLVSEDIVTPIDKMVDGKVQKENVKVADKTYFDVMDPTEQDSTPYSAEGATGIANWTGIGQITGSDGKVYNKMTTSDLKGYKLASGEKINVYVTFKVNRTAITQGINNSIELGTKNNIAEITRYSTYYEDGKIAGRVDKDSAPDNINIMNHNEKNWYEDDTDSAPAISLNLYDEVRTLDGMVWEDSKTNTIEYGQKIGNGEYNEGEKKIPGLTVKLVEKVNVNGIDYDYIWPESFNYNGTDLMKVMELHSKVLTNENGEYEIKGVPAGNYVVRFVYGSIANSQKVDEYMLAAEGDTTINQGFNGHDYKSTIYQDGFNSLNNVWYDFDNTELRDRRVSDAKDDEIRRMEVIAYSRTLTNGNDSVLKTADDENANHDTLAKYTAMVANTAKFDIEVEYKKAAELSGVETNEVDGTLVVNGTQISGTSYQYNIPRIDFGLEKRPNTELELSKQIKRITLTSSTNTKLLDVIYNHEYTINDKGEVEVKTTVDKDKSIGIEHVQSIDNIGTTQGFRYINVDSKLLQGTTVEVEYEIAVFNVSEVDRIGELAKFNTGSQILEEVAKIRDLYRNPDGYDYGKYVGKIYYTGEGNDNVVTTTVDQVIDYVDNNFVFNSLANSNVQNGSWRTASMEELLKGETQKDILDGINNIYKIDNKGTMVDSSILYKIDTSGNISKLTDSDVENLKIRIKNGEKITDIAIMDNKGTLYITEQRNNIALSVSDASLNPSLSAKLIPYSAYSAGLKTDETGKEADYKGSIRLTATRFVSPETDSEDLQFNNLSEIIQFSNTAGRRDEETVIGNANPAYGEFMAAVGGNAEDILGNKASVKLERDVSATEVITLSPPTGVSVETVQNTQYVVIGLITGAILIVGIILIKKCVLDK